MPISASNISATGNIKFQPAPIVFGDPHRYWRILVEEMITTSNNRWRLSQIDFWENEFGRPLTFLGTVTASSEFSTSPISNATNELISRSTTNDLDNFQTSSTFIPHWVQIDFGVGNTYEVNNIVLWDTARTPSDAAGWRAKSGRVQWSDNGTDWTDHYTFDALEDSDWTGTNLNPFKLLNPNLPPHQAIDLELSNAFDPLYIMDLSKNNLVFSDNGITQANNNDPIYLIDSQVSGASNFEQPTTANRVTFKTGGTNGWNYLESDGTAKYFEDVPFTQPSGVANYNPWAIIAVCEDIAGLDDFPSLWGANNASGFGKAGAYFRETANEQWHFWKSNNRRYNIPSGMFVIGGQGASTTAVRNYLDGQQVIETNSSNMTSNAVTNANVLRNQHAASNGYFNGKLYYMAIVDNISSVNFYRACEWARGKWKVGAWS